VRQAIILLYHQIAELDSDPWSLSVTPRHFAEHLEIVQRQFCALSLRQLVQGLDDGHLPRRSVVITFDDGYADNLHNAKPLLERYDIPATVFLITGSIGQNCEFWWDELDRLLLQPRTLPEALQLNINGNTYSWKSDDIAYYEGTAQHYPGWRAWEDAPTSRHILYRSLWEMLHPMSKSEQRKVLDSLLGWAGAEPFCRLTRCVLKLPEVTTLAQGGLIEIGAHTVTHSSLSALPVAAQRNEIWKSKTYLEENLGSPVTSFSYPYGKQGDYTVETVKLVREAGFACACSNFPGVVQRSVDRFQLPRLHVHDWDGEMFSRWLWRWFQS
jgi:peptidoglycan/xylan/chitin deacetylase (PgdA/CDA1 family)